MKTPTPGQRHLERECQRAVRSQIQWMIEDGSFGPGLLIISGWALRTEGIEASEITFSVNSEPFTCVAYPLSSQDLTEIFWDIPDSQMARFQCAIPLETIFARRGFYKLELLQDGDTKTSTQTAWYFPDPEIDLAVPDEKRIKRVIGVPDLNNFILGGATIFCRFDAYLKARFGKSIADMERILDWGCGSGRIARYSSLIPCVDYWGVDIDGDNVDWCRKNVPEGTFLTIPMSPITDLPAQAFDLIIGISVFTHLDETAQFDWLHELRRVLKPDGIIMVSIQGNAQSGLYRTPESILQQVELDGFSVIGKNEQLNDVFGNNNHYLNVVQSKQYIYEKWGEVFDIVDISEALAANQDVVVMKKR